jgi:Translation initiation factor eIF3 subunit
LLEYASLMSKKYASFEDMTAYPFFVETVVRDLVVSLSLEDTRKVSACLNVTFFLIQAMINEKQKAFQSTKGKKKKKAGVVVSRQGAMENYGEGINGLG